MNERHCTVVLGIFLGILVRTIDDHACGVNRFWIQEKPGSYAIDLVSLLAAARSGVTGLVHVAQEVSHQEQRALYLHSGY